MAEFGAKMPQFTAAPYQFAFIDDDELFVAICCLGIALFVTWYSFLINVFIFFEYYEAKRRNPRGFLQHFMYYIGIGGQKSYPNTFVRKFFG